MLDQCAFIATIGCGVMDMLSARTKDRCSDVVLRSQKNLLMRLSYLGI
jgi:hypothetical protein